ncbi:monocarboxylate transporter 10-like [Saccostrea echinata]|uniref:monocarboxylate transporter 10-like n=1 Tax=Saccostrea echinata TaxID=191078 RepID=UPI002A83054F|nr:monocarboxylate transporter 10-like [Saccostrea echinata]
MGKDSLDKETLKNDSECPKMGGAMDCPVQTLNSENQTDEFIPIDGGWGWVVCFTSLLANGTVSGIINTFGIIYVYLIKEYARDDPSISFKISWIGSVCTGSTFFMCLFSSVCSDRIGIRPTAFFGALFGAIGLFSSAFIKELGLLYLTYGLLIGSGGGFITVTSLIILGHYFKKHLGLANGIVGFGSSGCSMIISIVLPISLETLGIKYTFLILGGLYCMLLLYSLTWIPTFPVHSSLPISSHEEESQIEKGLCSSVKKYLNLEIFKNRAYRIWFFGFNVALFGYFVPLFHLVKHTQDNFPDKNAFILITCIQVASGIGRLIFGKIADLKCVNRIYMQQSAFVLMGIVTACIPFSGSFEGLIVICLILGVCDGITVFLIGTIAFDIVGPKDASQGIGFLLCGFSVPLTVGPPIAGLLYDTLHTYEIAFVAAGAPPILGALIMCFIPRLKQKRNEEMETNGATIVMTQVYRTDSTGEEEKSLLDLQKNDKDVKEKSPASPYRIKDDASATEFKSLLEQEILT